MTRGSPPSPPVPPVVRALRGQRLALLFHGQRKEATGRVKHPVNGGLRGAGTGRAGGSCAGQGSRYSSVAKAGEREESTRGGERGIDDWLSSSLSATITVSRCCWASMTRDDKLGHAVMAPPAGAPPTWAVAAPLPAALSAAARLQRTHLRHSVIDQDREAAGGAGLVERGRALLNRQA